LGFLAYGVSMILFVLSLRHLGAARTSAYFGIGPFAGTLISFMIFREPPNILFLFALPLMVLGAILLLGERHDHVHAHVAVEHEHRHIHDEHHAHAHAGGLAPPAEGHSHMHRHEPLEHGHFHRPDTDHRHEH
jgi:hypothetical protein